MKLVGSIAPSRFAAPRAAMTEGVPWSRFHLPISWRALGSATPAPAIRLSPASNMILSGSGTTGTSGAAAPEASASEPESPCPCPSLFPLEALSLGT